MDISMHRVKKITVNHRNQLLESGSCVTEIIVDMNNERCYMTLFSDEKYPELDFTDKNEPDLLNGDKEIPK